MIITGAGTSMDLDEAAAFLGIHPNTLQERAKARIIPGAKEGKEWRFLDADLVAYMRGKYKGEEECRSTSGMVPRTGGTACQIPTGEKELEDQLARLKEKKRKESTTKRKRASGRSNLLVVNSTTP